MCEKIFDVVADLIPLCTILHTLKGDKKQIHTNRRYCGGDAGPGPPGPHTVLRHQLLSRLDPFSCEISDMASCLFPFSSVRWLAYSY